MTSVGQACLTEFTQAGNRHVNYVFLKFEQQKSCFKNETAFSLSTHARARFKPILRWFTRFLRSAGYRQTTV